MAALLAGCLLSGSSGRASTVYSWANTAPGGGDYAVGSNWSPATVPADTNAFAWVANGGTVNFNGDYLIGQLYVAPVNSSTGYFRMNGGNLWISTNNLWLGGTSASVGINSFGSFTLNDGTLTAERYGTKDVFVLGQATNSTGIFSISNGAANFFGGVEIGFYGYGAFNIYGGMVVASSWFQPGRGQNGPLGSGVFTMTGGQLYVLRNANNENNGTRGLNIAQAGTNGVVNISGGALYANRVAFTSGGNVINEQINVSGGDLYIGSDGISGSKAGVSSVNISGGTFHTLDMLAWPPTYPGDISSVLDDGADWTWSGQAVNLTNTIPGMGGAGYVTFAPEPGRTITLNNQWFGIGSMRVNGPGTVAMGAANTYTGNTTVYQGTLAVVGSGTISNTPGITLFAGATLDASARSSALVLGPNQTLANSSSPASLGGNIQIGAGTLSLLYAPGTPSFTVISGTLSLATNTVFNVNNTGPALLAGNYKLISATNGGMVSGAGLPQPTVAGSGVASGEYVSLGVSGSELYLVVTNNRPPRIASDITRNVMLGSSWQISIAELANLAGWSDPDGDPITFTGVTPLSADGISVTTDGTNIYYSGPLPTDDRFQYTITDGKLSANGLVFLDAINTTAVMSADPGYKTSLDGSWRFYFERLPSYYSGSIPNISIVDSSQPFQGLDYVEGPGWTNLAVPGNWEMAGFSPATYFVPDMTSGLYRRWFDVPASWQGRQVYLNFDGVQDSAEVWVNGQPALVNEPSWGLSNYHESGWTAFQVNLTPQVRFGTSNLLAIRVVKQTPSVDLDTGDYFILGGIHRSVTLYSVPQTNFANLQVETHLLPNNQARVDVWADVTQGGTTTPVSMFLDGVETVTNAANGRVAISQVLNQPRLWSAEFPNLYPLVLQLKDPTGQVTESISNRIGIREITITNGVLLLNGAPVKLAGVCNHDASGTEGNAVGPDYWRKDLEMMKANNINAIRTTHYPFGAGFYDLCDELGMYVTHELPYCWVSSVGDLNTTPAFEQRAREAIRRDRNHPSVILWAIGNENNAGTNLQIVADLVKAIDPSRPRLVSTFAGSKYNVELSDRHYPSPSTMVNDGAAASSTGIPYVYMEQPNTWDVRLGADAGMWERWGIAQQRVWDVCMAYRTIAGTFPFEWSDRAVADPNSDASYQSTGVQLLYYFPATGVHALKIKGIVDAFGNERPRLYETKMIYSPLQLSNTLTVVPGHLSFLLQNRYCFTDASCLAMPWRLERGGVVIASGTTNAPVAPLTTGTVQIDVPPAALAYADTLQVDFIHPDGRDVVAHRFTLAPNPTSHLDLSLPANLPIPQFNLIIRQTVNDTGYWKKVLRYPSSLVNVVLTPPNATTLGQLQNLTATVIGGTTGSQTLGQLQAQYANNRFTYSFQYTASNAEVQELGWIFQMPTNYSRFAWDRNGRWTVYPDTDIGRASGIATPDSMNADISWMDTTNAFDFNSTKYDCNWASLTSTNNTGLRLQFDSQQPFQCRAGVAATGTGYVLFANQWVSVPNDFATPVVPDLILTLYPGNTIQGSFQVGSYGANPTSADAVSAIANLAPASSISGGTGQFNLSFSSITNSSFSVWASTNLVDWVWLAPAQEISPGQYQFSDPGLSGTSNRFYRVSSP